MAQWIVNKYGVIHSLPDDRPIPAGSRPATQEEINRWQEQDAKRKKVVAAQKQQSKIAAAKFVVNSGSAPDDDLTEADRQDLGEYRADPANPNLPYADPKPLHNPRPTVYPPTGEAYNPLTGLPNRFSGIKAPPLPPEERTKDIPYDPATGDYLRVTPGTPLDPTIEPPAGQVGGRPPYADVNARVVPGDTIEVTTAEGESRSVTIQEGGNAAIMADQEAAEAAAEADKATPQGSARGTQSKPSGAGSTQAPKAPEPKGKK